MQNFTGVISIGHKLYGERGDLKKIRLQDSGNLRKHKTKLWINVEQILKWVLIYIFLYFYLPRFRNFADRHHIETKSKPTPLSVK